MSRRRDRHPDVFADLDMEGDGHRAGGAEQQVVAEGRGLAGQLDVLVDDMRARDEVALLVEFAVVRQVGLRDHAQDGAAMDHNRRVVEPPADAQRGADDQDGKQLARCLDDPGDRALDFVEQGILQQQVLDGVGRKSQLGEDHDGGACLVALTGQPQRLGEVVAGVGDAGTGNAARHTDEVVRIEREEI
jgi:hypothetical protein